MICNYSHIFHLLVMHDTVDYFTVVNNPEMKRTVIHYGPFHFISMEKLEQAIKYCKYE